MRSLSRAARILQVGSRLIFRRAGVLLMIFLVFISIVMFVPSGDKTLGQTSTGSSQFTFSSFDCPNSGSTRAFGVNNLGQIVGLYVDNSSSPRAHGFYRDASGTCITIDVPGAGYTEAHGINDAGQITGYFGCPFVTPPIQACISGTDTRGFLLTSFAGTFTYFSFPSNSSTYATSINSSGQIVGYYCNWNGLNCRPRHGFFRTPAGAMTSFDAPSAIDTLAIGTSDNNDFVGGFTLTTGPEHGFWAADSLFTQYETFDGPGAIETLAIGVNKLKQIVGRFTDSTGKAHGFLRAGGALSTIDYPNSTFTEAWGINNVGQIVGVYADSVTYHGFIARRPPVIAIDAGHGDNTTCPPGEAQEPGPNTGPTWRETESDLVLEIAKQVASNLNAQGFRTFQTRPSTFCESLLNRVLSAVEENAAVLVSIHLNAASNSTDRGTEVWYDPQLIYASSSLALAKLIVKGQMDPPPAGLGLPPHGTGANPPGLPGVKLANVQPPGGDGIRMKLLRLAKQVMPANLDEVAFLSNSTDEAFLHDSGNRLQIASVISNAIARYFSSP